MKFFSFDDIRAAGDCAAFARDIYNATIKNGRCAAVWRGGDGPENVSISKTEFYDHVQKKGGGIIELAAIKFNGDIQQAQAFLGDLYHLTPKMETGPQPSSTDCRYERLKRDGYVEVNRYEYRDLAGAVRHITVRMEHPDREGKEFVQGHPDEHGSIRWSLKDVDTILYRLPEIVDSSYVILCYPPDTEVLTPNGWVRFDHCSGEEEVAQWTPVGDVSFVRPSKWQKLNYNGSLISHTSEFCDLLVTPDHRMIIQKKNKNQEWTIREKTAQDLTGAYQIPVSGFLRGGAAIPECMARLSVCVAADGGYDRSGTLHFNIKKDRKKMRLRNLLESCGITWREQSFKSKKEWTLFSVDKQWNESIKSLVPSKCWHWGMLGWSEESRAAMIDEIAYWDGDGRIDGGSRRFFTAKDDEKDVVCAIAATVGYGCICRHDLRRDRSNWIVNMKPAIWRQMGAMGKKTTELSYNGMVYCCSVPSTWLLVRRNGKPFVSGNCEGEKSADRIASLGLPATTAPMGAGKWRDTYTDALQGKNIAIFPDNDPPGIEHAQSVARALHGRAASIKIVGPLSTEPKGGIDDWVDEPFPPRTDDDVIDAIAAAPEYEIPQALLTAAITSDSGPTEAMLAEAKSANTIPFRNYIPVEKEVERRGGRKQKEVVQEARTHQAMLDDLSKRFLGFPRKQGEEYLFDHDRDTGEIIPIRDSDRLLAWIGRRSKHPVSWGRGDSMVTARQFMASVIATAHRYESISLIPSWPRRSDVYYAHDRLPPPDPALSRFRELLSFFCPTTEHDRNLLAAFICAPLWYIPGIPRPAWVIDSRDGQGCGKTTLVELVSQLYGHAPICTSKQELALNLQQIVKRCVSHSGRGARVFLVDNVTGDFHSDELSFLITSKDITGMAPYGHGEETRPNDLTYVMTCNTATVSTDLADRSMYIMVSRPPQTKSRASWKTSVLSFIDAHRLEIVADIVHMLSSHTPFSMKTKTRFPEFETMILQPCCGSADAMTATLDHIATARAESNIEEDQARAIIDVFTFHLTKLGLQDEPCFIRTELANSWGRTAVRESTDTIGKSQPVQLIRNLAKTGMLPKVDPNLKRWPTTSAKDRFSGVSWGLTDYLKPAYLVYRDADETVAFREVGQGGQTGQA